MAGEPLAEWDGVDVQLHIQGWYLCSIRIRYGQCFLATLSLFTSVKQKRSHLRSESSLFDSPAGTEITQVLSTLEREHSSWIQVQSCVTGTVLLLLRKGEEDLCPGARGAH